MERESPRSSLFLFFLWFWVLRREERKTEHRGQKRDKEGNSESERDWVRERKRV